MSATKLVLKSTTSTSLNDRFSQIMGSRRTEEPTRVKKNLSKNVQKLCQKTLAKINSEFPELFEQLSTFTLLFSKTARA